MPTLRFKPNLLLLLLLFLTIRCQPSSEPILPPTAETSPPAIRLIPTIAPGDGSDVMDKLLERGVLRVGIRVWPSAEFSPPAFRGASNAATGGALTGFEVDIARLLADGLGLELELIEAHPPLINSGDWQGAWDIALASLVPFDQSASRLHYSQPYGYMPMGMLISATTDDIQTITELAGRTIGVLEESGYETMLRAKQPVRVKGNVLLPPLPPNIQIIPVSNLTKAIDQLANSEETNLQAIFAPAPILEEAAGSGLPVKLALSSEAIGTQPLAVAVVSQDDLKVDRLLAEINKVLERAHHQGVLAEIYLRWYAQDLSRPRIR